jgi:tRNA pseudouridine55 synthase
MRIDVDEIIVHDAKHIVSPQNTNILTAETLSNYAQWHTHIAERGGVALLDKESGWTSFDVVAKMRGITRIKKVGHAGTLDPLATGLLIVCFGAATKIISSFQEQTKVYEAVLKLGAITKTDDAEAEEECVHEVAHITNEHIHAALPAFIGTIRQIPPMFSALKKNGVPLYVLARKGREIEREARTVQVYSIEVMTIQLPLVCLRVVCSKGTYIRSLARDIGTHLGCGAYLHGLRRTAIGECSVEHALKVQQVSDYARMTTITSTVSSVLQNS